MECRVCNSSEHIKIQSIVGSKDVKIMAKKEINWAVTILSCAIIACLVGAGMYLYYTPQVDAAEARATSLQSQLASQAAVTSPAYLALTEAGDFDFIDEIDANGGVPADDTGNDATLAPTLLIENDDTSDVATNVYITMWDPESSVGGVPAALEDTTMSFYVTYNGVLIPLYLNTGGVGEYTNGVNIGTVPIGGSLTLTLSAEVDAAADDVYDDSGATYTVRAYVYQADAQSSTPASWTLST